MCRIIEMSVLVRGMDCMNFPISGLSELSVGVERSRSVFWRCPYKEKVPLYSLKKWSHKRGGYGGSNAFFLSVLL